MSKTANIKMICLTGMFMALICIATLFFKVPIPLGYAHLGNVFIFLAGAFLANPYALIAAGVGSALADLLGGYAEWILPTLIIKCIMGAVIAGIAANGKVASLRTFAAVGVGIYHSRCYFIWQCGSRPLTDSRTDSRRNRRNHIILCSGYDL